jgi:pyrroline-5-carboxylate reductase
MPAVTHLTILGCGAMGHAILEGLFHQQQQEQQQEQQQGENGEQSSPPARDYYRLALTARRPEHLAELQHAHPRALVTGNNLDQEIWAPPQRFRGPHVVVLGVRGEDTEQVCGHIAGGVESLEMIRFPLNVPKFVVIVLAPSVTGQQVQAWLPEGMAVVRAVPEPGLAGGLEKQKVLMAWGNEHATEDMKKEAGKVLLSVAQSVLYVDSEAELEESANDNAE